jgi:hypothetical protein
MSIRVGRIKYPDFKVSPVSGYQTIYVMTNRFPGKFNALSPFYLKDEHGRIMENVWQFSRCFSPVAFKHIKDRGFKDSPLKTTREDKIVHLDSNNNLTPDYFIWRQQGANFPSHIRYSNGFHDKHTAVSAYRELEPIVSTDSLDQVRSKIDLSCPLNYVESRKQIYIQLYLKLVKIHPLFAELKTMSKSGVNLLIVEVDGPHQESLNYYKMTYNVGDNFIQSHSMEVTQFNIDIMLNDPKHNFGHGYCLAMALADIKVNELTSTHFKPLISLE